MTCGYISRDKLFAGPKGTFHIDDKFTWDSSGVVYAIQCTNARCGHIYIGETGRKLKERFREHRQHVIKNTRDNEVASHFNQVGHNGVDDMSVLGLQYKARLLTRKLDEQKIIAKLGCVLGQGGMNTDLNFPQLLN